MLARMARTEAHQRPPEAATIRMASRAEIAGLSIWQTAFSRERKDRRYYEVVEDTLKENFEYGYLLIEDKGAACAVQPYFVVDQDLLAGLAGKPKTFIAGIRRLWPRFMRARTMMVGCVAGEGHLDGDPQLQFTTAALLAQHVTKLARQLSCRMVVLKEFPAKYRALLQCLRSAGFARIPSMPMTTLRLDYKDFEEYLCKAVSQRTRARVRHKLRIAAHAEPAITMSVVADVSAIVDRLYPLYEKVFERSSLRFEKLTKEFLCEIGRRMPDKVRFFVWHQDNRIIAFGLSTVQGDSICNDYVGFDYSVAHELCLYYRAYRDIIEWAIANGYKRFYSTSLGYDPKWHLRQSLYPVDLYVRHTSGPINAVLRWMLPLLEPTHFDPILPNFGNYRELWI